MEGGGRVKRRLSRGVETAGNSSCVSICCGTMRGSEILPVAGGGSTKKSLAITLAVMWEGAVATQEVCWLPSIRGKRFARTRTSEKVQTQTAAHCTRVRRRGRVSRSESIGTPASEDSSTLPFYTRGAKRGSRPSHGRRMPAQRPRSRFDAGSRLRVGSYCLP